MKTLATIFAAIIITATLPLTASARGSCGIPPIPPIPKIGCREMQPVCQCSRDGECWWVFVCVPR